MQLSRSYNLNTAAQLGLATTPFTGLDIMRGFIGTAGHDNDGIARIAARSGSGGRMRCRRI